MTLGEISVHRTIKQNIDILDKVGLIVIDTQSLRNLSRFSKALNDLQAKGYITYSSSFISVIIKLTDKGRMRISKNKDF